MNKKASITVSLVKESTQKPNEELEREITQALSKYQMIPWTAKVEEVKVTKK